MLIVAPIIGGAPTYVGSVLGCIGKYLVTSVWISDKTIRCHNDILVGSLLQLCALAVACFPGGPIMTIRKFLLMEPSTILHQDSYSPWSVLFNYFLGHCFLCLTITVTEPCAQLAPPPPPGGRPRHFDRLSGKPESCCFLPLNLNWISSLAYLNRLRRTERVRRVLGALRDRCFAVRQSTVDSLAVLSKLSSVRH